jgi:hypothetical protein
MLPNLIIIGAERSGTTSLHSYLGAHPQVFMSRQKELNFFVAEKNWKRGRSWYERQFPEHVDVRGESSPSYTAFPALSGVPERMAAVVPQSRLLYLVRDPVERAISAYHLARAIGIERRPATVALRDPLGSYVIRSSYATQLERYLAQFPAETILVVDSNELRTRRRETLRRIFGFLGVDKDAWRPQMETELNAAKRRQRNVAGQFLFRLGLTTIGDPRTRTIMRRAPSRVAARLTSSVEPTVLSPDLRAELESMLAGEISRLRELTGMRFESWSV